MGDPERYEWLQWIHYSETIAVHAAALVQQMHFVQPQERSSAVLRLEGRRLHKAIELLEGHLIGRDYLLRSGFSAADISVGYSLHLAARFAPPNGFARVGGYYDRLRVRSAFEASLPKDWQRPLSWLTEDVSGA
jgi:glutathione S-transferase